MNSQFMNDHDSDQYEFEKVLITKHKSPALDFIAGSIAGVAQILASQPFDTIKVENIVC